MLARVDPPNPSRRADSGPKATRGTIRQERQGRDGLSRASQPAPHVATVAREGTTQDPLVLPETPSLGSAVAHDHPAAHGERLPALLLPDRRAQPRPPMHHGHQSLRIHQLGLELDDEKASRLRVPGQDVDHASLAVVRERDLGQPTPAIQLVEKRADRGVEVDMRSVDQTVDLRASVVEPRVQACAERSGHGAHRVEWVAAGQPVLDPSHDLALDACAPSDIRLAQVPADADDPERVADAHVVHWQKMHEPASRVFPDGFVGACQTVGIGLGGMMDALGFRSPHPDRTK